jgi:hypothetical protein
VRARRGVSWGARAKLGDAAEAPPRGDDREIAGRFESVDSAPRAAKRASTRRRTGLSRRTRVSVAGFFFERVFGRRKPTSPLEEKSEPSVCFCHARDDSMPTRHNNAP